MSHETSLQSLQTAIFSLTNGQIQVSEFCALWRSQSGLLSALPPRYAAVMEDLLGRLEAGSLFTEESCSFSQADLQANLQVWLDKARQQVNPA